MAAAARVDRGALRPLRRPLSPPAAAFNSPSGAGWTPARSAIPARFAQGLGELMVEPPQGRRMRGRWTDSSSSRARTLLTTARALLQERRIPHCDMPHCDMPQLHRLPPGTIVNSWPARTRSAPRRISPESRRGARMRLQGSAGGSVAWRMQGCGSKVSRRGARHRPRRGMGCQFVSTVSLSLCPTFFSRVSP